MPDYPPYPGDPIGERIGTVLFPDYTLAGYRPDPGMGVWFFRTAYDIAVGGSVPGMIRKHQAEWRQALNERRVKDGLQPIVWPGPPPAPGALKGAFCIPGADISQRVWWPAFLSVSPTEQDRYIRETLARGYNFAEIQVSGDPYHNDYPYIDLDAGVLRRGLQKLKAAGLTTIVAFDDTRWPDLSYLRDALTQSADLIDWCMGIYEVNGVVRDPAIVLSLLVQSREMLPNAKLAVHFTDLVEGESHGLVNWHDAVDQAGLNALFFQAAGWQYPFSQVDNRVQDFTRRLMAGMNGYPILSDGVFLFELTTSKTYRYEWTEQQGIDFTNALMSTELKPDAGWMAVRPTGWCDGGTV